MLGLIGEGTGIAAKVLKSMGISLKEARIEAERRARPVRNRPQVPHHEGGG